MEKSRFGRVRESKRQGVRRWWLGRGLHLDLVLAEVSVYRLIGRLVFGSVTRMALAAEDDSV